MKQYKFILLSVLLCVVCLSFLPILAIDDYSTGSFEHNAVNDPPTYTDWLNATTIYVEWQDVLFYAIIEDVDNSSGELTVTLYYSNDSFASVNVSQALSYQNEPSPDNYNFTYVFPGKAGGTYYEYYYQAYDGGTRVKKPVVGYMDIQWGNITYFYGAEGGFNPFDFFDRFLRNMLGPINFLSVLVIGLLTVYVLYRRIKII